MSKSTPKTFDEALDRQLRAGKPVDAAIAAARQEFPALYAQYRQQFLPEVSDADAQLAQLAVALAKDEGIDLATAQERVCNDPKHKHLVNLWMK